MLVGLVLSVLTGIAVLDPALAALVALNILWSGWRLIRQSLGGLMDEAVPGEELEESARSSRPMRRARSRPTTCAPAMPGG